MKVWFERRIREAICLWVRARHEMVKPKAAQGLFNYRCFSNAAEWARTHPGDTIVEVVYIDDGYPILHYLNVNAEGDYLETTLGYRANNLEYYLIRRIHQDDHAQIEQEFNRALRYYLLRFTNWFHRRIIGIDRVL